MAKRSRRGLWRAIVAIASVAVLVVGGLLVVNALGGKPSASNVPSPSSAVALASHGASAAPSPSPASGPTQQPTNSPAGTPRNSSTPTTSPSGPTATPIAGGAPTSAAEFDLVGQVIDIAFPLRADTRVRYRDNWLDRRPGSPDPYNHARVLDDGRVVRAHDGIDLYAVEGSAVVSPFAGTVIDPATRWIPWEADRYGLTVVIESDEPATAGYTAVLVHLQAASVNVGQHVSRGEQIGVLGETGNAEGIRPQLHFELRAPFVIDWSELGERRSVDAFNPFPSLVAADPHR